MKKMKMSAWIVVLILSIVVILGCGYFALRYFTMQDTPRIDPVSTEATEVATVVATETPVEAPTERQPVSAFDYTITEPEDLTADFGKLEEINTDIYAWLYIPGTDVDYPVVQSISDRDDTFYLSHNIYRQYQFSGSIYSEVQNKTDFSDRVTVLYGHNMLNGSMFASLHRFADPDFFDEHNAAFILTKDKIYTYLIYAAYVYDDRHILNSFNLSDDEVFKEYLDSTLDPHTYNGNVRDGVELDINDRILTLSTCTNGAANTRYLVQGVLADERER